MAKPEYPGTIEIVPGVFVDPSDDPAVYIADDQGEVVCWCYDEIKQDPTAWIASLCATIKAAVDGATAVREHQAEYRDRLLLKKVFGTQKPALSLVPKE